MKVKINGIWESLSQKEFDKYLESLKTQEQINLEKIGVLKKSLADTDYQALKAFEGTPSDSWEEIKANRKQWRIEIKSLKGK